MPRAAACYYFITDDAAVGNSWRVRQAIYENGTKASAYRQHASLRQYRWFTLQIDD
jgi:hypothetical protein